MITKTFDEVFTMQALYRAHVKGRLAKRDKKPIVRFELATMQNLNRLYDQLHAGTYRTDKYHTFTVAEPKKREIQTLPYANRVVQHVICDDLLSPYFSKRAILDNCACQKGKGGHLAMDRFQNMLQQFIKKHGVNGYILKCDILKYFPTIPHATLKKAVLSQVSDAKIRRLISEIIDSYHTRPAFLKKYDVTSLARDPSDLTDEKTFRGVPIGNQTSQVFGMFYLNPVDRLVKERLRVKAYSRYMDDFVLIHQSKQFLISALEQIRKLVDSLGLTLNDKTQIHPLKNGFTYLGFRFAVMPSGAVVRMIKKKSKKRLRWRARLLKKAYLDGIVTDERIECSKAAIHGHLVHGDCHNFERELAAKLTLPKLEQQEAQNCEPIF
ncbi:MAG: RNA-directed DNA polymerase [Corallococcus sp.]|nr:RNA-directed DNA polymerase [Corallococcus sp.]MCM1359745.1 RNA-directed DNA polymerase [Corallococcus sp.]MCM1395454.1 RNA-directed DNA polymerase [Corallococcus sp.]